MAQLRLNNFIEQLLATTLAFILLGTSAFSAEIKMTCDLNTRPTSVTDGEKVLFKYADRFLIRLKRLLGSGVDGLIIAMAWKLSCVVTFIAVIFTALSVL